MAGEQVHSFTGSPLAPSILLRAHFLREALPEQHQAVEFARRGACSRVGLAYYGRADPGHETVRENGIWIFHLNRTQALEEMFHSFQTEAAELPRDARALGGRVREGLGEYYRQMMALIRGLEQNSTGNWVARYVDRGKADHYAHAEVYCQQALAWEGAGFLF